MVSWFIASTLRFGSGGLGCLRTPLGHPYKWLVCSVDSVVSGTCRTAWSADLRSHCSYAHGSGSAVGPPTGGRSWELLRDLWRAVALLMKPWCSEEEVPTSANLTLHGGSGSRYGGTATMRSFRGSGRVQAPCLGECWFSALLLWKRTPSLDCEADSCWLHHGDMLVMDGRCQDEYVQSTDPKLYGNG